MRGLKRVYAGPRAPSGRRVFPGFSPGGEVGTGTAPGPVGEPNTGGWDTWIAGTAPGLQHLIQDSLFRFMVFEDPDWDWRTLDFEGDVRLTDDRLAAVLNATDPDLTPFQTRGGKLVMFHGWSDPAIPPLASKPPLIPSAA